MPTNEEYFNLYKETNDIQYRNILLENNYNLIWSVIRSIPYHKINNDDLFQIACIHFLNYIDNYDPNKNTKFSTYMFKILKFSLMREEIKHYTINSRVRDGVIKYDALKFIEKYYAKYYKQPTIKEISQAIKEPEKTIKEVLSLESVSLDTKAYKTESSETTIEDIVSDDKDDIADFINEIYYKQWVKRMLSKLSKVKQQVIIYSFGIDCEPLTLEEISVKLNISYRSAKTYKCDALRFLKKIAENYQHKVDFA